MVFKVSLLGAGCIVFIMPPHPHSCLPGVTQSCGGGGGGGGSFLPVFCVEMSQLSSGQGQWFLNDSFFFFRCRTLSGSPRPKNFKKIHFIKNMRQHDTRNGRYPTSTQLPGHRGGGPGEGGPGGERTTLVTRAEQG